MDRMLFATQADFAKVLQADVVGLGVVGDMSVGNLHIFGTGEMHKLVNLMRRNNCQKPTVLISIEERRRPCPKFKP